MTDIELVNITYNYFEEPQSALSNVSLHFPSGSRVVLLGENGSGKSTLLGVLGGMHKVQQGSATVLGRDAFLDTTLNADVARIGSAWGVAVKWPSTVEGHVSLEKGLDPVRYQELLQVLSINPKWRIDKISDGQRRRVQILLGLLKQKRVILLDECANDIDAVDRLRILQYFQEQSIALGVTVVFATHILDGLETWATRVVALQGGKVVHNEPVNGTTRQFLTSLAISVIPPRPDLSSFDPVALGLDAKKFGGPNNSVLANGLEYKYDGVPILRGSCFDIPSGSRVLVIGRNGSGKSTLLRILGGTHFIKQGTATCCGKPCFHDSTLVGDLSLAGSWWEEGSPEWDLSVLEMIGGTTVSNTPYVQYIVQVLGIDLSWRVRRISAGQRKRVQLLLTLQNPRKVILLDEATADLDVVQRKALLTFLEEYNRSLGATILYCTHIFEDMLHWPEYVLRVSTTTGKTTLEKWDPTNTVGPIFEWLKMD